MDTKLRSTNGNFLIFIDSCSVDSCLTAKRLSVGRAAPICGRGTAVARARRINECWTNPLPAQRRGSPRPARAGHTLEIGDCIGTPGAGGMRAGSPGGSSGDRQGKNTASERLRRACDQGVRARDYEISGSRASATAGRVRPVRADRRQRALDRCDHGRRPGARACGARCAVTRSRPVRHLGHG
jgi:hypothetical protein